ncbi:phosphatase PAP2 family protein [Streptomyces laurentii]|uniref:phosphatase PAP2 family protein n=1 Tax=Streptomyces laurentii TaxID=39478 RepID=UPI003682C097
MSSFTPPIPPDFQQADWRLKTAKIATEALSPAYLAVLLLVLTGAHRGDGEGLLWGMAAAVSCGLLPWLVVHSWVRRGKLTDRNIRLRSQRLTPLAVTLALGLLSAAMGHAAGAPPDLVAVITAISAGVATGATITVWWQMSGHTSMLTSTVLILAQLYGPAILLVTPLIAVGAWSRLALKAHTPAQVCAGTALGTCTALAFALLR